ncbi:hypothetical protein MUY14_01170 [Amycolatopsis sp. FBCC-B4732]|uniref:hypothetical protein n=1 Tax=Amycolatopsis sp. FBCC-B4732 TaxID=3079339 RepID=UPI001FF60AFE|nr:hypothetical protein [Amycolatopsis sp. FBCC-B4732]UOX89284.1 hypothetical protein MUY14_01170 [Amycolatopsis sp. FBCC-B4732]
MISRPRTLLSVVGVVVALALALTLVLVLGDDDPPPPVPEAGLDSLVTKFTAGLSAGQEYRSPKSDERRTAAAGFAAVVDRRGTADFEKLGFSVRDSVDPATGRPYTIAVNEAGGDRAWGMYVIDRSAPPSLVVEVPHPAFDLRTELFGVDLFRRVPGAVLLVAGAHRKADDGKADVAHEEDSVFHVVATGLAGRGLPQVQLHGFHDQNLPSTDVVLSSGATVAGDAARRAADRLTADGFAVCRAWEERCKGLEGTTNVQGKMAAADDTVFLHVEMSRTVRESPERRADVVRALTEADLTKP